MFSKEFIMSDKFMFIGACVCALNMILAILEKDIHSSLGWFVAGINALIATGCKGSL